MTVWGGWGGGGVQRRTAGPWELCLGTVETVGTVSRHLSHAKIHRNGKYGVGNSGKTSTCALNMCKNFLAQKMKCVLFGLTQGCTRTPSPQAQNNMIPCNIPFAYHTPSSPSAYTSPPPLHPCAILDHWRPFQPFFFAKSAFVLIHLGQVFFCFAR